MKIIRERRLALRITQTELAEKVGCSRVYLSELESGKKTNVSSKILIKIMKELDLKLEDIENAKNFS